MRTLLFFMVLMAVPALAQDDSCRTDPPPAAACFTTHGVLSAANGAPTFRIWEKTRILGVHSVNGETTGIPPALLKLLLATGDASDVRIAADYRVCPFTRRRPGWMQMVCIESASHMAVRHRESGQWRSVPQDDRR
jgi:hypothetical protein